MANNVTFLQLRTDARLFADERPSGANEFITDTEAKRLVNLRCREFYDLLVAMHGDERFELESTAITTANGTAVYSLPAAFYRATSVHLRWATDRHELVRKLTNVDDRDQFTNYGSWAEFAPKAYRLRGAQLELFPTPTSAVTVVLRYVPAFTDLSADGDTLDDVNGWSRLVTLGAAIDMRTIAGLPVTILNGLFERERERIETLAADRAINEPAQIRDVRPEETSTRWWMGPPP